MPQTAIFGPFFLTIVLTIVVWITMFSRRIPFILNSGVTPEQLAVPSEFARLQPAWVSNPSDNFKNLFEVPVLFYALALYLFVTNQVDHTYVLAAWFFAVFRVLHSLVHCTFNHVNLRFALYAVSTFAVYFIAIRAALAWFQA